jgi:hypothetical protein
VEGSTCRRKSWHVGGVIRDRRDGPRLQSEAVSSLSHAGRRRPGMTSGFRDDYRQSIASGNKAVTGNSYHGGSRRGGYGHGLAADVVSVKGETRSERCSSSERMWKWIDAHGKEFGIGRPYLDKDPPHIAPIDGKEYADKRGGDPKLAEKGSTATGGDASSSPSAYWPYMVLTAFRDQYCPAKTQRPEKSAS